MLGLAAAATTASAADITGAGATFPYPIYAKWAEAYKAKTGIGMNYQSIGSGGGIKQIKAKTVDFGASDMPLKPEELEKAGLMQFPADHRRRRAGREPRRRRSRAQLKLTGPVLADIYLGKIKKWNDKAIADLNAGVKLPDENDHGRAPLRRLGHDVPLHRLPVEGERRVEGQGRREHGGGVAGRRGRQGQRRRRLVRAAHQGRDRLRRVRLRQAEQDGARRRCRTRTAQFVQPDDATFQAAAAYADWKNAPGFYQILTDQPGKNAWPITGASFILMHAKQDKPAERRRKC